MHFTYLHLYDASYPSKIKSRPVHAPPHLRLLPLSLKHLDIQVLRLPAGGGPVHGSDVPILLEVVEVVRLELHGAADAATDGS